MKKSTFILSCLLISPLASCGGNDKVNQYKITFYDDVNNVLETVLVDEGKMPAYSKGTPTKEGTESTNYTFNKWIPEIKKATEDASYIASFNANLNKYVVNFDSDGGSVVPSQEIEWGKTISSFDNPTKADSDVKSYKFEFWYDTALQSVEAFNLSTPIKQNYNLKAKWSEEDRSYLISYNSNGGSPIDAEKVLIGEIPTKPIDPTHDDSVAKSYVFSGWYLTSDFSGEPYDFASALNKDTTLYAKWDESDRQFNVDFVFNGKTVASSKVGYGKTATAPETDPKDFSDDIGEYKFISWNFDFSQPIVGNTTINANFDTYYNYNHYLASESTCKKHGCVEFYETLLGDYSLTLPSKYHSIIEKGSSSDVVDRIMDENPDDERLLPYAHKFDDISGNCIYDCGTVSITASCLDTSKMALTSEYTCPFEYGNLYKYNGYAQNIFSAFPIEGLTKIKFFLVNPDVNNTFILNGNASNCVGGVYGGLDYVDGIIATKGENNNWTVTRESGIKMFSIVNGTFTEGGTSYVVENPTYINQIFKTFTYAKAMYLSDVIVEGTVPGQKSVLNDAIFVGTTDNRTYSLVDTGEKVTGYGKKYEYSCTDQYGNATAFRELFKDIDITQYQRVEFYINLNKDNYLTFVDDNGSDAGTSGAYGLHGKDGGHVPGIVKAYNEGNGTWRITGVGIQFRAVNGGAKTDSFTYHNRNTLKSLFKIGTSNCWQKATMNISDVIVVK